MSTFARLLALCLATFLVAPAFGSPQEMDRVWYGGHRYAIAEHPMLGLWHIGEGEPPTGKSFPPNFDFESPSNWLRFSTTWEIWDSRLWLRSIRARVDGRRVRNNEILPNFTFPAEATWFTGKIHLPVGNFSAETQEFESVIEFSIDKGVVTSRRLISSACLGSSWNGL